MDIYSDDTSADFEILAGLGSISNSDDAPVEHEIFVDTHRHFKRYF